MKLFVTWFTAVLLFLVTAGNASAQCGEGQAYCWPNNSSVKQGEKIGVELYYNSDYPWPDATFYIGLTSDQGRTWAMLLKVNPLDKSIYDNWMSYDDYDDWGYTYLDGYYYNFVVPSTVPPGNYLIALLEAPNNKGDCAIATSYGNDLTVVRGCNKPVLKTPVSDVVECSGSAAMIKVDGPYEKGNIWYDWYKDGSKINTSFEPYYTFPDIKPSDAGSYYAIINDICNLTTTTNTFKVVVNQPGIITTQPAGKTVCQGNAYSMKVVASGTPLTYQWYKNGVAIPGKVTDTYSIASASAVDEGVYTVVVMGGCGDPDTSDKATIAVPSKPLFTTPLQGGFFCPGTTATISPDVTGTILAYQWYRGDDPIPGAHSRNLTISGISTKDNGIYWVQVSVPGSELSGCPAITNSARVYVGAYEAPVVKKQPTSLDACAGSDQRLVVEADGTDLTYQWFLNGTAIPNSNNYSLALNNVTAAQAGDYTVQVTGACGFFASSNVASVHVYSSPSITAPPQSTSVRVGETITLSIEASNAQNVIWMHNEKEISRGTATTLTITNAQPTDAGYYRALVENACGGATSRSALVGVIDPASLIPTIGIASSGLDAGQVPFGYSADRTFTALVVNAGNVDITVTGYSFGGSNAADFAVQSSGTPYVLTPGQTHEVVIRFTPSAVGSSNAMLTVASSATAGNNTVPIVGSGVVLYTADKTIDFGVVDKLQSTIRCVTIVNPSAMPIVIDAITISGANSSEFTVTTPLPMTIDAGQTKEFCVEFTPLSEGVRSVQLTIMSSTGGNSNVTANGTCEISAGVVEDGSSNGMSIYPNPTSGNVTLSLGNHAAKSVMVFDIQGTLIRTLEASQQTIVWDLRDSAGMPVASGSYNVLVTTHNGSFHIPLQVTR